MTNLDTRTLARLLGGDVAGSNHVLCPGPGHSPVDRSLSVKIIPGTPEVFITHSFSGDDWRDCREWVRARLGLQSAPYQPPAGAAFRAPKSQPIQAGSSRASVIALSIFSDARLLGGTIGETYLARRMGRILAWPDDLRFHTACRRKVNGRLECHPAVIALLRDIRSNKPCAIQRIFLKADGSDRLRDLWGKMSLGPSRGACVKLSPDEAVAHGLGITEGIETGLSMLSLGWSPIWVTAGTAGLAAFPVLNGVEALKVFADNDENNAGDKAALACVKRWREAGREASGIMPRVAGQDWADVARGTP